MARSCCRSLCCCCSPRCLLFTICCLQLISSTERQVFDFLGQMWAPIIFNFVSTIVTLIGLFGIYYHRVPHLSVYAFWQTLALAWNCFVVLFYLQMFSLSRDSDLLNLGTGSRSWWESNGPNCSAIYDEDQAAPDDLKPVTVEGCLLAYYLVETLQASLHFILSAFGFILSVYLLYIYSHEDDSSIARRSTNGNVDHSLPPHYSITFHPHPDESTLRRGTAGTRSLPHSSKRNQRRSSTRSSTASRKKRRRPAQNKQLILNQYHDVSSLDSFSPGGGGGPHSNPMYCGSNQGSRYSLYTIDMNREERESHRRNERMSPIYMNSNETVL